MPSRTKRPSPLEDPAAPDPSSIDGGEVDPLERIMPDLSGLPIAGIGRRQVGMVIGAIVAVWIVVVFARQVGDASAASTRAASMVEANAELRSEIASYRRELEFIQRQAYVVQQARGYGLGKAREIPFALAPDAPPLPPDAPGSAAVRVGAELDRPSPLDRWLELLFGSGG